MVALMMACDDLELGGTPNPGSGTGRRGIGGGWMMIGFGGLGRASSIWLPMALWWWPVMTRNGGNTHSRVMSGRQGSLRLGLSLGWDIYFSKTRYG